MLLGPLLVILQRVVFRSVLVLIETLYPLELEGLLSVVLVVF